jgi:hypothetical protein
MVGGQRCTGFWWENLRERDHWGDPVVDGMIIFRCIFKKWDCEGMDWIGSTHERDRWWALVIAVINFRVPYNAWNILTSCKPFSFSRRTLLHGVSK